MAQSANQPAFCAVLLGLMLISCSRPTPPRAAERPTAAATESIDPEVAAGAAAYLPPDSDTPYEDIHGAAGCVNDCSGNEAGYKSAAERDVRDAGQCSGEQSFVRGCQAYVQDHTAGSDHEGH